MRRLRDYSLCLCLLLLWPLAVNADDSWRQIQTEARGQTVWFNAWGGDPAVNRYLAWVSEEVKRYYAIDLRIVPVADAADAVKRIQTEAQAGRRQAGQWICCGSTAKTFARLNRPTCCSPVGPNRCPTGAMSICKSRYGKIFQSLPRARSRRGAAPS